MMKSRFLCLLGACGLVATSALAQSTAKTPGGNGLRVPTCFADHMVLQRDKPVPIWGWAPKGTTVTVSFAGQAQSATAGDDGRWIDTLEPLEASAAGRTMKIAAGGRTIVLDDILVGDVWLCSGQSNMAAAMGQVGYVPPSRRRPGRGSGAPKGIPDGFDPSRY